MLVKLYIKLGEVLPWLIDYEAEDALLLERELLNYENIKTKLYFLFVD